MSRLVTPRALSPALAFAGVAVAGYLTVVHYRDDLLVCAVGGCERVQQSHYSEVAGIPVALLGLSMYLAVLALCGVRWSRPDLGETATIATFVIVVAGALYAAYLTYVEIAVIDAICQWCVISALLTLAIVLSEGIAVYHVLTDEDAGGHGE